MGIKTKLCSKCGDERPIARFRVFRYVTSDGMGKFVSNSCMDCANKEKRESKTRKCDECRETKSKDNFRPSRGGLSLTCKECEAGNDGPINIKSSIGVGETKTCSKCGGQKHIYEFSMQPSCRDGRRTYCKKCEYIQRREKYNRANDFMNMTHIVQYLSLPLAPNSAALIPNLPMFSPSLKIYSDQ